VMGMGLNRFSLPAPRCETAVENGTTPAKHSPMNKPRRSSRGAEEKDSSDIKKKTPFTSSRTGLSALKQASLII